MNYSDALASLKKKYPNLAVIEVWANVLYLRMSQGRCVFHSKKGTVFSTLEVGTWVLATENDLEAKQLYKKMAIQLHPDKKSGCKDKFIKLKKCYENYETIRARLGGEYSERSEYLYYKEQDEEWFRETYGSYEEYVKRRREQDEYARQQVEELGVPF